MSWFPILYLVGLYSLFTVFKSLTKHKVNLSNESYEFKASGTYKFLVASIYLVSLVFYLGIMGQIIYDYARYNDETGLIAMILGTLIILVLHIGGIYRKAKIFLNHRINQQLTRQAQKNYCNCPFCGNTYIFFRVIDVDYPFYFLVNEHHELVLLGDVNCQEHFAGLFMDHPADTLVLCGLLGDLLVPYYYDSAQLVNGQVIPLSEELYCSSCLNLVVNKPVTHGIVELVE